MNQSKYEESRGNLKATVAVADYLKRMIDQKVDQASGLFNSLSPHGLDFWTRVMHVNPEILLLKDLLEGVTHIINDSWPRDPNGSLMETLALDNRPRVASNASVHHNPVPFFPVPLDNRTGFSNGFMPNIDSSQKNPAAPFNFNPLDADVIMQNYPQAFHMRPPVPLHDTKRPLLPTPVVTSRGPVQPAVVPNFAVTRHQTVVTETPKSVPTAPVDTTAASAPVVPKNKRVTDGKSGLIPRQMVVKKPQEVEYSWDLKIEPTDTCKLYTKFNSKVLTVHTPYDFYVEMTGAESNECVTSRMGKIMNNFYKSSKNIRTQITAQELMDRKKIDSFESLRGTFWACIWNSDWYRVRVVGIRTEEPKICVLYVDYGNSYHVNLNDLYTIKSDDVYMTSTPAAAIKCAMNNLYPVATKNWPVAAAEYLENQLHNTFQVTVVKSIPPSDASWYPTHLVSILSLEAGVTETVAEVMVEAKMARSTPPVVDERSITPPVTLWDNDASCADVSIKAESPSSRPAFVTLQKPAMSASVKPDVILSRSGVTQDVKKSGDAGLDAFIDDYEDPELDMNSYGVDDSNPVQQVLGYQPSDQRNVCRFYSMPGGCKRGVFCSQKHIDPSKENFMSNIESVVIRVPSFDLKQLTVGNVYVVRITAVEENTHACLVWASFPFGSTDIFSLKADCFQTPSEIDATYGKMFQDMKRQYSSMTTRENMNVTPAGGQVVAVKRYKDGSFFRARVMPDVESVGHNLSDREFDVQDVDTGVQHRVRRDQIFSLKTEYAVTEAYATQFLLEDVKMTQVVVDEYLMVRLIAAGDNMVDDPPVIQPFDLPNIS